MIADIRNNVKLLIPSQIKICIWHYKGTETAALPLVGI